MLSQREHNALVRLTRSALGDTLESRKVAHWLLKMEGAEDVQNVPTLKYGLSTSNASDVRIIAKAVQRENRYLTDLGQVECTLNMMSIVKVLRLPVTHRIELREWLKKTGGIVKRGPAGCRGRVFHIPTA